MNQTTTLSGREPLAILVAALGGQGGGVLTEWIVHAARTQGLAVQATSTPGVAQRTGATTYYIELAAADSAAVLGLAPLPGRVDVLVCSELLEAARMLERGFCTPARTCVVASTHRVYTTREKMNGGDGRYDDARILDTLTALARRRVLFDMEALRLRHRTSISAVLFGALAGSGVAGLERSACEAAIRASGKGVDASLAAFAAAWAAAGGRPDPAAAAASPPAPAPARAASSPAPAEAPPRLSPALAAAVARLPAEVVPTAHLGAAQVADWQDDACALRYLERLQALAGATPEASRPALQEAARWLALWTCYDDIIQVARVKSRRARLERIVREAGAAPGDIVRVHDFFKPGMAEIADVLPARLGAWLARREGPNRRVTLQTSSPVGALLLRLTGALRRWRPASRRWEREQAAIDAWLAELRTALGEPAAALEVARLPRLLKGYGDTHARGESAFTELMAGWHARGGAGDPQATAWLRQAVTVALAGAGCGPSSAPPGALAQATPPPILVRRPGGAGG